MQIPQEIIHVVNEYKNILLEAIEREKYSKVDSIKLINKTFNETINSTTNNLINVEYNNTEHLICLMTVKIMVLEWEKMISEQQKRK